MTETSAIRALGSSTVVLARRVVAASLIVVDPIVVDLVTIGDFAPPTVSPGVALEGLILLLLLMPPLSISRRRLVLYEID